MKVPSAVHLDRRRFAVAAGIILIVVVTVLVWSGPLISRRVRILAGPEGSTYHTDALAYADFMRRHGVIAEVIETEGSLANLQLLQESGRSDTIALAETGLETLMPDFDPEGLVSLGSVQVTPFWLFVREGLEIDGESDLAGRLIVPGEAGSAVRALARLLIEENGLPPELLASPLAEVRPEDVREVLEAGRADAAFVVGSPGSPVLDGLLRSDLLTPVSIDRAQAYDRRHDRLGVVTLPQGAFDLAHDIPAEDLVLIAAAIQIVAPEGLPEMLTDLVLDAASEVHRGATLLTPRGAYPRPDISSLPLSPAAERFYAEGPSPLRRVLPFWAATLANRFVLGAAAILGVLVTMLSVLPALRAMPFQRKLGRIYRQLESIEKRTGGDSDRDELLSELDQLIEVAHQMTVPRQMVPAYFEMRQNIHDLRDRVATQ